MNATRLENVEQILARWRASKRSGDRIPEKIWVLAVSACAEHPVSVVAKRLQLDYYQLRSRLTSTPQTALTCSKIVSLAASPEAHPTHFQIPKLTGLLCEISLLSGINAKFYVDCEALRVVLSGGLR